MDPVSRSIQPSPSIDETKSRLSDSQFDDFPDNIRDSQGQAQELDGDDIAGEARPRKARIPARLGER
jgi:hypothetical protein